jgi:hypothetical protein
MGWVCSMDRDCIKKSFENGYLIDRERHEMEVMGHKVDGTGVRVSCF